MSVPVSHFFPIPKEFDMKTVTMLRDDRGAPHGHTVVNYMTGQVYEMSDDLADVFIETGSAVEGDQHDTPFDNDPALTSEGLFDAEEKLSGKELQAAATELGLDIKAYKNKAECRDAIRELLAAKALTSEITPV